MWRRIQRPASRYPAVEWVVFGLGNPGREYEGTRHNLGREVVEALAARWGATLDQVRHRARFGFPWFDGRRMCLAVPLTYMNGAGEAAAPLVRDLAAPGDRLLVISDDLDLALGTLRVRPEGGSGGHRGLESVSACLGTSAFGRVRLGIGRPHPGRDPADYVLERFSRSERLLADEAVRRACDAVEVVIREGLVAAMNAYNG